MRLAEVFQKVVGSDQAVEFSAYDGSHAGPEGAGMRIEVRTPMALSYLASAPGELGLARAYVTGKTPAAMEKVFWRNSRKAYRWVQREPTQRQA